MNVGAIPYYPPAASLAPKTGMIPTSFMVPFMTHFTPESLKALFEPTYSNHTERTLCFMNCPTRFVGYTLQCGCYHWQGQSKSDRNECAPLVMFGRCNHHQICYLQQMIHDMTTDIIILQSAPLTRHCRPGCGTAAVYLYPGPWFCDDRYFPPRYYCSRDCYHMVVASANESGQIQYDAYYNN